MYDDNPLLAVYLDKLDSEAAHFVDVLQDNASSEAPGMLKDEGKQVTERTVKGTEGDVQRTGIQNHGTFVAIVQTAS